MDQETRLSGFDFDGDYGVGYEALARTVIPAYETTFRLGLALLQGRLDSDARVLVVGAGTGIEIVTLRSAEPGWRCTGVDPSRQMIEIAERRLAEAGITEGVELVCGLVDDLPDAAAFSAATCFNVLHFLADDGAKAGLLASISDRLQPGATLLLHDLHGQPGTPAFEEGWAAWRAYWKLQGMGDPERASFRTQIEDGIRWASGDRIVALLQETGFTEIRLFFKGLLYGGWIAQRTGGTHRGSKVAM